MKSKLKDERNKRYYLHSRLKGVCNIDTIKHVIRATDTELESVQSNKYVQQLVNNYGYSIQLTF